ncbi:MAG: type I DNA topoisomerase [Planctomycetota bacterium]
MMAKSLVIVESPAKAQTINKILGTKFVVKASMGHVRDLPKGRFGIDVEHGFAPQYQTIRGRGDTIADLKKISKKADYIYLAPDPDREGEAIAWHLAQALEIPEEKTYRVTFNEITKKAIGEAFKEPGKISMDRVNAQQARRILDRIVGYKLSPLLWEKIAHGLSGGRVQSVAVRLIVERELEIRGFRREEFWRVQAKLADAANADAQEFGAEVKKRDGQPFEMKNEAEAQAVFDALNDASFVVEAVENKKKTVPAAPPLTTSLLQQQASIQLRFTAKRTMMVAQQLYEGVQLGKEGSVGLITYMRTDSYRVSDEAIGQVRKHIESAFGKRYLPEKANVFAQRKGAQLAHEAIRPTDVSRSPDSLRGDLTEDQYKLYRLIWRRFVASQMTPAEFNLTDVTVKAGSYTLAARGRALLFDGHTKVIASAASEDVQDLPKLAEGQALLKRGLEKTQHFTQPPPRYTEATLVKALEKKGIGRPSTYATIISTIQERGYVKLLERKFHATELGEIVTGELVRHFPKLIDTDFTSDLENKLDLIEEARVDWLKVLREFYDLFMADLERAAKEMTDLKKNPVQSDEKCENCGRPMVVKFNKRGRFLACSGYPECKSTRSLDADAKPKEKPIPTDEVCGKCGSPMVIRTGRRGRFMACTGYPKCRNTFSVDDQGKPLKPQATGENCEKCGSAMVVKHGRRGPFLACSGYPKCRNAKSLPKELAPPPETTDEKCDQCGAPMAVRFRRRGRFLACTAYPACKRTRPLVATPAGSVAPTAGDSETADGDGPADDS